MMIMILTFTILIPVAYVAGRLITFKRKSIYEYTDLEILVHNYTPP